MGIKEAAQEKLVHDIFIYNTTASSAEGHYHYKKYIFPFKSLNYNQQPREFGQEFQQRRSPIQPWCCSSVAASKQGVVLSWLLSADTRLARLQGLQWGEGDTQAFGPHGWSPRLQVLVPKRQQIT